MEGASAWAGAVDKLGKMKGMRKVNVAYHVSKARLMHDVSVLPSRLVPASNRNLFFLIIIVELRTVNGQGRRGAEVCLYVDELLAFLRTAPLSCASMHPLLFELQSQEATHDVSASQRIVPDYHYVLAKFSCRRTPIFRSPT